MSRVKAKETDHHRNPAFFALAQYRPSVMASQEQQTRPLSVIPSLPIGSSSRRSTNSSPRMSAVDSCLPRRLSNTGQQDDGALLNALEAEEERLVLLLTRKLELLRADKAKSENAAEYDTENMVLKLQRQLSALQQQQMAGSDSTTVSPIASLPASPFNQSRNLPPLLHPPLDFEPASLLDALKTENDQLRSRVASAEIAFARERRLNDVLRSEVIDLRNKLDIDTSDLVGLSPTSPPMRTGSSGPSSARLGTPRQPRSNRDRSDSISNSILSTLSSEASLSLSPPISESSSWTQSVSQTSYNTTPSSSYPTTQVPINTPVRSNTFRTRAPSSSSNGTEGEIAAPPSSLSTSLADSVPSSIGRDRGSGRVAETGQLSRRRSSAQSQSQEL